MTFSVPDLVVLLPGDEIDTLGLVVSPVELETLTERDDVVALPAASVARAFRVWVPFEVEVVAQE